MRLVQSNRSMCARIGPSLVNASGLEELASSGARWIASHASHRCSFFAVERGCEAQNGSDACRAVQYSSTYGCRVRIKQSAIQFREMPLMLVLWSNK